MEEDISWPLMLLFYLYEIGTAKEARDRSKTVRGNLLGCSK
jgi:hypothetical protein